MNDGIEQAHELGKLLQGKDLVLNLIPWNPVYSPDGPFFAAPAANAVTEFQQVLKSAYKVHCTVRQEKGQDIAGKWWARVCRWGGGGVQMYNRCCWSSMCMSCWI